MCLGRCRLNSAAASSTTARGQCGMYLISASCPCRSRIYASIQSFMHEIGYKLQKSGYKQTVILTSKNNLLLLMLSKYNFKLELKEKCIYSSTVPQVLGLFHTPTVIFLPHNNSGGCNIFSTLTSVMFVNII